MSQGRWICAAARRTARGLRASVTIAVLVGPATATAAAIPEPSQDPFYTSPVAPSSVAPGAVLRSRRVEIGGLIAPGSTTAYQLLYRTTSATGQPIVTVTTLLLPTNPAPGERRLLSYQTAEDSLTTKCAPSYTMRSGTGTTQFEEDATILMGLDQGWAVVVPDYEGPDSQWTVGPLAGRAALDSVRAVEQFAPSGLANARTPVAMIGYSGGAIPTVWANSLQRSYAPELNLVGIAAGGIAADIRALIQPLSGSPFSGAILAALIGVDRAYPELSLNALLSARGRDLASRDGTDADGCSGAVVNAPFVDFADLTTSPSVNEFLAIPRVRDTLVKLELRRGPTPRAPAYFYNAINDQLVHIEPVDDLVRVNCAAGARIDYYRDPQPEHLTGLAAFYLRAYPYLEARFAGTPAPTNCPPGMTPAKGCAGSPGFRLHLHARPGARIVKARVYVDGKLRRTLTGARLTALRVPALSPARHVVRVETFSRRGLAVRSVRSVSACGVVGKVRHRRTQPV